MKGFIVSGTNSGCGKTTVTIGLMALLAKHGHRIAPFKSGPDFIDPAFHENVTGVPSYNLDSYLLSQEVIKHLYAKHSNDGKIAVIEGVMGLFDGLGPDSLGSTGELSRILELPVILVVNCKHLYQSAAAIVAGFAGLDPRIRIGGVFLNNLPNEEAYQFLKTLILKKTGIPCIGYLPHKKEVSLESRHLGLIQAQEVKTLLERVEMLSDTLAKTTDVPLLLEIASSAKKMNINEEVMQPWKRDLTGLRLAVARDMAFSFYYHDNLELLRENGAKLIPFSPLMDVELPKDTNAIYLGGGYPEVFASGLSSNRQMRHQIYSVVQQGMPVFAECGGLMYLTSDLQVSDGQISPMVGALKCTTKMQSRLQNFGYCEVSWQGVTSLAHEFHHSTVEFEENEVDFQYQFSIKKPLKDKQWKGGLRYKNVLAGYPHFHFASSAGFYHKLIDLWMQKTT